MSQTRNTNHRPLAVNAVQLSQAGAMAPVVQVIDPRTLGGGGDELKTVVTVADLVRYVKRRWKLAFGVATLVAAGILLLLVGRVPLYESEARVLVKMQGDKVFNFESVVDNQIPEFSAPTLLNNHKAEMATQKFREFVATQVPSELKERWVSNGGVEAPLVAKVMGGLKGLVREDVDHYQAGDGEDALDAAFTSKLFHLVKIDMVKETHILRVLVRHESPDVAAEMANLYARSYTDYVSVQDAEMTEKAREFLTRQAEELRQRVVASEKRLLEYRQAEGLVEVDERHDVSADRRKRLNSAIAEAEIELATAEQNLLQVRRLRGMAAEELAVRAITAYPGVEELHTRIVAKLQEKALLDARYKEKHPKAIAFASEFAALQKAFADQVERATRELDNSATGLRAQIGDLKARLGAAEGEVLALGDKNIQQTMLRSQLEADRGLYDKMVVRLNEANVSSQLKEATHLRLSETAMPSDEAVAPNAPLALVLSGLMFFGLFVSLPVVIGLGEDLVRYGRIGGGAIEEEPEEEEPKAKAAGGLTFLPEAADGKKKVAILGDIPPVGGGMQAAKVALRDGAVERAFGELATEIESRVAGQSVPPVYVVTSETAGAGKSMVAAGLGRAFGAQGKKTLVIDANLRSPSLGSMFDTDGQTGLAAWLESDGATSFNLESLRQRGTSLYVLPAGPVNEAPGSLLAKSCFSRLVAGALESFDRVIIDAPAAEGCPELFALLPHAGGIVAVSDRPGGWAEIEVEGLAERLGLGADRLLGAVVNRSGVAAAAA